GLSVMEIKVDEEAGIDDAHRIIEAKKVRRRIEAEKVRRMIQEEKVPLLEDDKILIQTREFPAIERNTWIQKAIGQTFQTTSHLANLLPTGTVLAYQILSPIFTNAGSCSLASRFMTATLVFICGFSCFILSFTDSYKDLNGNSCYGFATFNGFWIIDGSATLPPERARTYKLRFIDFAHAIMSFLVFGAVVMFDQNAVKCFIPVPSAEEAEILTALPVGIGVFCSMLFAIFPTTRHDEEAGVNGAGGAIKEEKAPLLKAQEFPEVERNNWIHKAIGQTFQTTAHLANHLPTGTALAYQVLSPVLTNGGRCDFASRYMTEMLVSICAFTCFILSFTDSYRDLNGTVCYGFATTNGLWIIDGKAVLPKERSKSYRLQFIDFAHAFMTLLVFGAVVMFDHNVVSCFFPKPSAEVAELLTALPVAIGVFCSMMFATFPTTRHGIGFPLSAHC
ncbi:hypothetical protein HID58_024230, partial [Brassica napus]